ncbi:MAG: hypothetical protein ACI905_002575 [Roseivirga sp.]|jgi:hypothetical protein
MSLLVKIKKFVAFLLIFGFLFSCEKSGDFGFGSDDVSPVEFLVQNVPMTSSVVMLDSLLTSNLNIGLIGAVSDPNFGNTEATTYSRLNLRKSVLNAISTEAILDSVKLNIRVGYLFNTSNKEVNLEMYKLAEELEDTVHTTASSTAISEELILQGTFVVDNLDSIYSLDVSADFGNNLFELMRSDDVSITNQSAFENIFPGVAFKSLASSNNVFGINLDEITNITFYYRDLDSSGEVTLAATHALTFGSLEHYYGLALDKSGSQLDGLTETNTLFTPTSGLRYFQSGVGIVTKLDISEFQNFSEQNPEIIINSAQFSLGPIEDLPTGVNPPNTLLLLLTDSENTRISDRTGFRAVQQDGANQIANTAPLSLVYDPSTKTYKASITTFITSYYLNVFRRNEFLIYPQTINNSLDQFIFDPSNVKIEVVYSKLR